MSRYMRVSAILLLVAVAATVASAEEIVTRDGSRFHITHNYWRDHLARHRNAKLEFWPDADTFPPKILVYMNGGWEEITTPRRINCAVTLTIIRSIKDWSLLKYCMLNRHWYDVHLAAHGQYPASDPKIISDLQKIKDNCSYPLKVSFDSGVYQYSDYSQMTLDRNTVWRMWLEEEDYERSSLAGGHDDLLRQMRYKLFGVFGLDAARNAPQNCLTVTPSNPYYLSNNIKICDSEREALQMLLFGPGGGEPPRYPEYPKPNYPSYPPSGIPNIPPSPPQSPVYNFPVPPQPSPYPMPPFPPPQERYPVAMLNQAYARIGVPREIYEGFESSPPMKPANLEVEEPSLDIDELKLEFAQLREV